MKRKLMVLGGSRYAIPVVEAAHKLGIYVITADYLPDNAAHRVSDGYCNVSVVDKEAVLGAARQLHIDGIMSFACDPGVLSAAYVAEKMGLPFQGPYESVAILQDKGMFRQFLTEHGFNAPHAHRYDDRKAPLRDWDFSWPVIVKPVDSAGSKGVTKVNESVDLEKAIECALSNSRSGCFIVEDFLSISGYRSDSDPFVVNGQLAFAVYSDQRFDATANNPYAPAQIIWPSTMPCVHQRELSSEIQRLMGFLGMETGIYNIEACLTNDGKSYIMEASPRGGGNNIACLEKLAFGVDLIECEVRHAVGLPLPEIRAHECDGCWCEYVIHAKEHGIFQRLEIAPEVRARHVKAIGLAVRPGDAVHPFTGANMSLGDLFLRCDTRAALDDLLSHANEWLSIMLQGENKG